MSYESESTAKQTAINVIMQRLKDTAVSVLQQCVTKKTPFSPLALIPKWEDQEIVMLKLAFCSDEDKIQSLKVLGETMTEHGSHEVIVILDCFARMPKTEDEVKYILENWNTERPSLYPASMRQDALILQLINFKDSDFSIMVPYRVNSGKVELVDLTNQSIGLVESHVRTLIASGFIKAHILKRVTDHTFIKRILAEEENNISYDKIYEYIYSDLKKAYPNL